MDHTFTEQEAIEAITNATKTMRELKEERDRLRQQVAAYERQLDPVELLLQRHEHMAAVEALVMVFEGREGWRQRVAWAVRQQTPENLSIFSRKEA